jgi:hypothetical protein
MCRHAKSSEPSAAELAQSYYRPSGRTGSIESMALGTRTWSHTRSSSAGHQKDVHDEGGKPSSNALHVEFPTGTALTGTSAVSCHARPESMHGSLLAAIDAAFAEHYVFVPGAAEGSQSYVQYARRCAQRCTPALQSVSSHVLPMCLCAHNDDGAYVNDLFVTVSCAVEQIRSVCCAVQC